MQFLLNYLYKAKGDTLDNFLWRLLQILGKQGIAFLIFILSAKLLSPQEFGTYSYVLALVFVLTIFSDFGISSATSKFIAQYSELDKKKVEAILFNSILMVMGLAIVITFLFLIFARNFLGESFSYLLYLLPLVFLAPMTSVYDGVYRGLKKFKELALISILVGFLSLFFIYMGVSKFGLVGALVSQNIFYAILLITLFSRSEKIQFSWNLNIIKEVGSYSIIIGIGALGYYLYTKVGTLFLGSFGFIKEAGYFEIINNIFLFIAIPFNILGQVVAPDITRYSTAGDYKAIKEKYLKYCTLSFVGGLIIGGGLFLFVPVIMQSFLPEYLTENFIKIFNVMLLTLPLALVSSTLSQGFTIATGKAKYTLLTIPFGLLNIFLMYFLTIKMGFIGIIYGLLISTTLNRVLTYTILFKDIKRLS